MFFFVVVVNVTRCFLDDDNWLSINTMQIAEQNTIENHYHLRLRASLSKPVVVLTL
jgi:hypothetical protein